MSVRSFGALGATFWLTGCIATAAPPPVQSSKPPPEIHTPITLTKADVAAVQAGARASLKDPDSAKFGRMVAGADSKGEIIVCLMINAKNSYGGYTGEKPHMGMLLRDKKPIQFLVVPGSPQHPEFRDQVFYDMCRDYGLSL